MEDRSLLQNPFVRALMGFMGFVVVYFILGALFNYFMPNYFDSVTGATHQLTDIFICVGGCIVWMVFFAQFVLPVKTIGDRFKVVDRLVTYTMGGHGPAIFVENGIVRASAGESTRKGPGVIWLDSASAAVLRTPTKFTRTIGPGVHFTSYNETIAATADLHQLNQTIGPDDKDVNEKGPFKIAKEHPDYDPVQKRRWETSAMTRDGIEVLATIAVTFHIKANPGEGNTPFGFNKENAEKAIRDSIVRGAALDQPVWSELPARMAVDVWREYLRKFRLSELFDKREDSLDTSLQTINAMMGKRLKQKDVEQLDDFGRVVLKPKKECREIFDNQRANGKFSDIISTLLTEFPNPDEIDYRNLYIFLLKNKHAKEAEEFLQKISSRQLNECEILTSMGLEVLSVNIKRVVFAPDIEEKIIDQWTNLWAKNAQKERDQVERDRKLAEITGQEDALKEYAFEATRDYIHIAPDNKFHALEMLVHSTFLGVRRNSALLKRTNTEQRELSDIFSWLRDRRGPSA